MKANIFIHYLEWQFFDAPRSILRAWRNFLKFNINYFSIPVLLKTFFAPWHRYRAAWGKRIDPWHYFEVFVFNSMSRGLGAVLRLFFIFSGIFFEVLIILLGVVLFLLWLILPFLLAVGFAAGAITGNLLIFVFTLAAIFWYLTTFWGTKIKAPKNSLSFEAARALAKAKENSSSLFYALMHNNPKLNFIFSRALLSLEEIKKALKERLQTPEETTSLEIVSKAIDAARAEGREIAGIGDMLIVLARQNPVFQEVLVQKDLKSKDIENLVRWQERLEEKSSERKKFWEWKNLIKKETLAKTWTAGYTITLDKFSHDITQKARRQGFSEVIGHRQELEAMERILARRESKNNVMLVGEPGSGRKSIIWALAQKTALGESLPELNYQRIVLLDMTSLLAQSKSPDEAEELLNIIFKETVASGNVVLVIDEFHNFVGGEATLGKIDISGALASFLHLPEFRMIAITSFEGLHRNIERNSSILNLFEKVDVAEISEEETLMLLENLSLTLEHKHKILISYPALRKIIELAQKYLPATPFPEKALDLLDETAVFVSQTKAKILLPEHAAKIVQEKTQIPVGEIETKEREILLNLESLIHQRIVNQEEAVKEISTALRRARAEVTMRKGPMGAFLFLGPTGVGKTETSKALASIYFGQEEKMIRLDMSEFQSVADISRLLGSPGQEGLLTTPVRENPFSLILLDELEKAHLNLLNLFLQVLDEGHLTDGQGRKVNFKSSLIIATSNAGYQVILEALKQKIEWSGVKERILNYLFKEGIFRPEFINRFDGVVIFSPLSKENLLDIAELLLQKLKRNLFNKGIEFIITPALKDKIVEIGYNPVFGAREMRRAIQDKVENVLAQAILSGQLTRGSRVEIDVQTFQLNINRSS